MSVTCCKQGGRKIRFGSAADSEMEMSVRIHFVAFGSIQLLFSPPSLPSANCPGSAGVIEAYHLVA